MDYNEIKSIESKQSLLNAVVIKLIEKLPISDRIEIAKKESKHIVEVAKLISDAAYSEINKK